MPTVSLPDLTLAYDLHGDDTTRTPALLVMGFGLPGRVWRFVVPELAPERRVVTFDNRGVGQSDAPPGPYRMSQMADDAVRLLDHLGIERVHLVGVSMGGMVSQELALTHRDRVATVSLIATHPGGMHNRLPRVSGLWHFLGANLARTPERRLRAVARLLFPRAYREAAGDRLIEILAEDFAEPPTKLARRAQLAAVFHHDTRARLARLSDLPTLIVKPERDVLIHPRASELLHRLIPSSRIMRLDDAGHGLIRQKAPELGEALRAHFRAGE